MTNDRLRIKIASSLTSILGHYRHLHAEALYAFADHEMPGGDALVMLGPVADVQAFNYQQISEIMGRTSYGSVDEEREDVLPPLAVLTSWVDIIRDHRDQPTSLKATIEREAAYIRTSLDWLLGDDEDGDANFLAVDALASDLVATERRLEAILKDGIRVDRGAPCMRCEAAPPMQKVWGRTERFDTWVCPSCLSQSTPAMYRQALKADYIAHADRLTADDAAIRFGIPATRIRVWGSRYPELKAGKNDHGLLLYKVSGIAARMEDDERVEDAHTA